MASLGCPAPRARSARWRGVGVDRQGVDAARHQGEQGIIYEAMASDPAKALEAGAGDGDAEVAPFERAGMASMEVAVVDDGERIGSERRAQGRLDLVGRDAHRESGPTPATGTVPADSFGASSSFTKREM